MTSRQNVVLLVDDHDDSLSMYAIAFTASGFSVLTASDAAVASALARTHAPDAVVLDERLPDGSGAELAWELSRHEATRAAALLFLTGDAQARPRAIAAGCDQFLLKPCTPAFLIREVSLALQARRAAQAARRAGLAGPPT